MEPTLILHQTSIASVKVFQHVSYVINGESIVKAAGRRSKKFASLLFIFKINIREYLQTNMDAEESFK